uniref:Uncharacterized protein n=1 Tax=Romanomermis culicivorax TaxID=13658 RepID=A0A915KNX2_ROMCU
MARTELLWTCCGRPSASQPRTVDPTSEEVPQLAEEFAKMLHMEEQKKKNHLSRMALIKDHPNMMAAEYQHVIKKLELEMRLLQPPAAERKCKLLGISPGTHAT